MKISKKREKKNVGIKVNDGRVYDTTAKVIQFILYVLTISVITAYTAVGVLPVVCGNILSAMGVTYDTPILDLFALWVVPCGFIVLMIFVAELVGFRFLWKFMNAQRNKRCDKRMERIKKKKNKTNQKETSK